MAMAKRKDKETKPTYIVFEDTPYYPYVVVKTTVRDKAEREFDAVSKLLEHNDHVYLCTIVKEK